MSGAAMPALRRRGRVFGASSLGVALLSTAFACSDSSEGPIGAGGSRADAGSAGTVGESGAPSNGGGGSGGAPGTGGNAGSAGNAGEPSAGTAGTGGDAGAPGGAGGAPIGGMGGSGGGDEPWTPVPIPVVERGDEICGTAPGGSPSGAHTLRFENADAGVTVQIGRVYLGQGVGHSSIYGLASFALVRDSLEHCSGDPGDITETSYQNTHHNWQDRASANLEGVRYELYIGLEFNEEDIGDWAPTLSAVDEDSGAVVLEPVPLLATGGPISCWDCPGDVNVIVSEVMANNETTLADEHGEYEPWIELFNVSGRAIDLEGWTLSNELDDRGRWTLPAVTIPRQGYLVLFADAQPEQGELHTNFRLSPAGGAVILIAPSGITDGGQAFGAQDADKSFGFAFGGDGYVWMPGPTPGEANPRYPERPILE